MSPLMIVKFVPLLVLLLAAALSSHAVTTPTTATIDAETTSIMGSSSAEVKANYAVTTRVAHRGELPRATTTTGTVHMSR